MKIYNRTNQIQELRIYDRNTKMPYSIYVMGKSFAEIDAHMAVPDLQRLLNAGVFQYLEESPVKVPTKTADSIPEVPTPVDSVLEEIESIQAAESDSEVIEEHVGDSNSVLDEESPDEVQETEQLEVTKFVCDICGGEYASARGLARHKNSAHKE